MRSRLLGWCLATAMVLPLVACTRTRAKTAPEPPPLDVPAPPPRTVEPTEVDTPPPLPLVGEPARRAPARPARPAPKPEPAKPEPKTEAPKPEPPAPEGQPGPVEPAPKSGSVLQTTPTGAEGEVERGIRTLLTRASTDLSHVDYRALNPDARVQYDTAKRFVAQAEEALRGRNLVFARNLADKAAGLAAQLVGR